MTTTNATEPTQLSLLDMSGRTPTLPGLNLHVVVPATIAEITGWSTSQRAAAAAEAVDVIASGADVLWADPRDADRAPITAGEVRRAIAVGLAVLAYRRGGVSFGGLHWHAAHCPACPGPGRWQLPDSVSREVRGAFFTPPDLAADIVGTALPVVNQPHWSRQAEHLEQLAIADISCGSGAFLVAAVRFLAEQFINIWYNADLTDPATYRSALGEAVWLVYGVDVDPVSIELARLALQLLVPDLEQANLPFDHHLQVGDALVGRTNSYLERAGSYPPVEHRFDWDRTFPDVFGTGDTRRGFDAVVGNPPYLGGQKITGAFGGAYREHLVHAIGRGARGSADLAVYFWLRAHELISASGVVAMIATNTVLQGASRRVGHDQITGYWGWQVYRQSYLPWPTSSAAVQCAIVCTAPSVARVPVHLRSREEAHG